MEMINEQEKIAPGNKEACRRYYARNSKVAKMHLRLTFDFESIALSRAFQTFLDESVFTVVRRSKQ